MGNKQVSFIIQVDDNGTLREVKVNAKDAGDAIDGIGESSAKSSAGVGMLGTALKKYLTVAAVVGVLKNGVETIAKFERANSELASVLGTTADGIKVLTESAAELGRTTEFTASEVTSLQTSLARLGFNEGQITDMQEGVLKFAAAVGTDLGSAADFAGSALRAFGLDASDTQNLLDIMAASTSKSALSFSKLQESIAVVGPVANAFGLKAEEVTSLLGVLSNAGFDASSAATALRNILLNLADSNGKLASGLGYSARTMPEIINALKDLRDQGIDLNSTLEMTDKRSVAAFSALIAGADDVAALNTQLGNADGSLEQMYATMTDNVIGAFRGLQSAWEGFVLEFQNSKGPIQEVLIALANGVNGLTDSLNATQTGGKSHRQKAEQNELLDRFLYIGRESGREEMLRQFAEWEKDATAEYDAAIDRYNAHKSRKNKQAMYEHGSTVMNLADIRGTLEKFGVKSPVQSIFPGEEPEGGNDEVGSGILKDIEKYRQAVERAVEINATFNGSINEQGIRLKTMQSGISALIQKYGAETDAIRQLITEYRNLKADSLGMDAPLEKIDPSKILSKAKATSESTQTISPFKPILDDIPRLADAQSVISSLTSVMSGLGNAVSETAGSWLSWASNLLTAVASAIPAITAVKEAHKRAAEAAVAQSIAESAAFSALGGPWLAIAAAATVGASLIASISSIPKFASGGIAYGPTLGLFGEYSGASSNPEVVAPLNKLPGLLAPYFESAPSGPIELRARGNDLVAVIDRQYRLNKRR